MRTNRFWMLAVGALAMAIIGCAGPASGPPFATSNTPLPAATATPEPEAPPTLVVSLETLTFSDSGVERSAPFSDPASILEIVALAAGPIPEAVELDTDPYGYQLVIYDWGTVSVRVIDEVDSFVVFTSAALGDVAVATSGGVFVGSSREDALAAGAETRSVDDGSSATDDVLVIEFVEVTGTESLTRPGLAGREFVQLNVENGVVTSINAPSNDFSDL